MPKLKTHRGAAKRFHITAGGKVKSNHAKRRHILTNKTTKHKRGLRKAYMASPANSATVKKMIPYAK